MTEQEARIVRLCMRHTDGYEEMCEHNPRFKEALEALPDTSKIELCNSMVQEIIRDGINRFVGNKSVEGKG